MLIVMWMALAAHADVVDTPPECPSGAIGRTGHTGTWCAPQFCAESPCGDDRECENTGMCVFEEERPCGGMTTPSEPCTFLYQEHFGPCETDEDCSEGSCVVADYCVEPESSKVGGGGEDGCGCSSSSGAPVVFLLGLLPLAALRLRERR
jgi:uncharacterized protein (TIGR03382 family)